MKGLATWGCLALIVLLCVSLCLTRLAEGDFYWHLLEGQRILDTGHPPSRDDLSYTSAGRPWVDMQWLFEAILAETNRQTGTVGLDILKLGLITGGFLLAMTAALRRAPPLLVAVVALPAIVAGQERFALRPEAASFLMLGALLVLLGERRRHPACLGLAPPLIAIWANLHALYAVGVAALLLAAAADGFVALLARAGSARDSGSPANRPRPLILAATGACAAALLTPYGIRGWGFPLRLLFERIAGDTIYAANIAEFRPPFAAEGLTASTGAFALLVALSIGVVLVSPEWRQQAAEILLLAAFLALALLARRNMALFAMVALATVPPLAATAVERLRMGRNAALFGAALLAAGTLALLADVVTNRFFARDATQRYFGRGEAPGFYPHAAADFVLEHAFEGEVLNDLPSGGFLAWRFYPRRRVFIDGRLEVHDESLFLEAHRLRQDPSLFERVVQRYGVRAVLWAHREGAASAPLLRYLISGHGWRLVFVDLSAAVFAREGTGGGDGWPPPALDPDDPRVTARLLEELRDQNARSARSDPLPVSLRRLLPRRDAPVALADAAIFFALVGRTSPAERLFREAVTQDPSNPLLFYDLGALLGRSGDQTGARRAYEEALRIRGDYAPAREALALLLLRSGDPEGALLQWSLAERSARLGQASLEARGALLASRGLLDEAIEDYRGLVRNEPRRSEARAKLALLYLRDGMADRALKEAGQAVALEPRAPGPRLALARIRAETGDARSAERIYREVIADDPSNGQARTGLAILLASNGRVEEAVEQLAAALRSGVEPETLSREPALRGLLNHPKLREIRVNPPPKPRGESVR